MRLTTQISIGLILGVTVSYVGPEYFNAKEYVFKLAPLGDVFLHMIKMIVVPLIFSSLIMGIVGTGDFKKLGHLGAKALLWFELAITVALIVGLVVVSILHSQA